MPSVTRPLRPALPSAVAMMTSTPSARNSSARKISDSRLKPQHRGDALSLCGQPLGKAVQRRDAHAAAHQQGVFPAAGHIVTVAKARQHIQLRAGSHARHGLGAVAQDFINKRQFSVLPVAHGDGTAEEKAGELQIHELAGGGDGRGGPPPAADGRSHRPALCFQSPSRLFASQSFSFQQTVCIIPDSRFACCCQQAAALDLPSCKGRCLAHGEKVCRVDPIGVIQVEHSKTGVCRDVEAAAGASWSSSISRSIEMTPGFTSSVYNNGNAVSSPTMPIALFFQSAAFFPRHCEGHGPWRSCRWCRPPGLPTEPPGRPCPAEADSF